MKTRIATHEDIPQIIEMAAEFYQATGYEIPFDASSVEDNILLSMSMQLCFVSENEDQITGFILGLASPFLVNRQHYVCAELAWWVKKDFRHSSAGVKLLKALEDGAREAGCVMNSMMLLESVDPEKVRGLYEKTGYKPAERTYMRTL